MDILVDGAIKLGLHLSPRQLQQFATYYQMLLDWNQHINLTAITGYEEVQLKHFLDSLTVATVWPEATPAADRRLIDVGSGAGMPGIPLKVAFPETRLVLLESRAKKAAFLTEAVDRLGLDNVSIVTGRAEEVAHRPQFRERFNIAVSRAVALLPTLVELTLPFCAVGGTVIAQKIGDIEAEVVSASAAIHQLGGELRQVKTVEVEGLAGERRLIVIDKAAPTPISYPRRPGIPAKRPLLDKQRQQ